MSVYEAEGRRVERIAGDRIWARITSEPLDVDGLMDFVATPEAGATVVFSGTVRSHSAEHDGVTSIDYEAHEKLASARLLEIANEALVRFEGIQRVAVAHRTGNVALGESSVLVVCSATHRGDAFEAARYVIDTVKSAVPIWKNEYSMDGADWLAGETLAPAVPSAAKEAPLS